MRSGWRLGAARHGLVVLLAAQLLPTAVAFAEGEFQLLLPLVSAMALGMGAVEASEAVHSTSRVGRPPTPTHSSNSVLPQRLRIPDGYALDFDRSPRRFADPVDRDRIVGFDVLHQPHHGWRASVAYDEEKRGPFPGSGEVVRFLFERRF